MKSPISFTCLPLIAFGLISVSSAQDAPVVPPGLPNEPTNVKWKKTVVDTRFRAEGAAVADVNHDGKNDILVGDFWYEAPNWTRHEIRKPGDFGDGANGYSEAFMSFADDYNADGWSDLLVVPFPGKAMYWYENPQNKPGHWKQHMAWTSSCNETPIYADLFGDGKKKIIMASCPEGQMAWFAPGADPTALWTLHPISGSQKAGAQVWGVHQFDHGLGAGDMNGDGRADVLVRQGWWEQPEDAKTRTEPWKFHVANIGEDCANMIALEGNGDAHTDVITSSAHKRGMWFHKREPERPAGFSRHTIFDAFTQTHALNYEDVNGDGVKDLITGKRWWAHGPQGDVEPMAPAVLYWFEIKKTPGQVPTLVPHMIDNDSGIGTQFWTGDFNGDKKCDVVIGNKKGVFLFEQS
jgi:hypothetical protein